MRRPKASPTLKKDLLLLLKGVAMGAANKVPGVSGGMVAFVAGFYEELIYALQHLNFKAISLLFKKRYRLFWEYVNGRFLVWLFAGVLLSFFSVSLLLDFLIEHYEKSVWGVFFGMITASLFYIHRQVLQWKKRLLLTLLLGFLFGIAITFVSPSTENDHLIFVFFCGMISVSGMTLPGLSGSFLLLILGNYNLLLVDAVNNLYYTFGSIIRWDFSFLEVPETVRLLKVLVTFTLGSICGLILLSNLLSFVLKKYHQITIAVIIGFIVGTLRIVWPWKAQILQLDAMGNPIINKLGNPKIAGFDYYTPDFSSLETLFIFLFMALGALVIVLLENYDQKRRR